MNSLGSQYYKRFIFYRKGISGRGPAGSYVIRDTYPTNTNFSWNKILIFLSNSWQTWKIISKEKPQVIIVCDTYSLGIFYFLAFLIRSKIIFIYNTHFWGSLELKNPSWYRFLLEKVFLAAVKKTDNIVCVSHGLCNDLRKRIPDYATHISVIENGIDDRKITASQGGDIMSIGRFEAQKDFVTVIKAFHIISQKLPTTKLFLVGDGSEKQMLKNVVRDYKLQKKVIFLPWQRDIHHYLKKAGLLLFASHYEGFGRVIVESMQAGVPVIATDTPYGPAEIMKHPRYGFIVPRGDYNAMAQYALQLLENQKLKKQYQSQGFIRAKDYSVKKMITQYQTLFSSVL